MDLGDGGASICPTPHYALCKSRARQNRCLSRDFNWMLQLKFIRMWRALGRLDAWAFAVCIWSLTTWADSVEGNASLASVGTLLVALVGSASAPWSTRAVATVRTRRRRRAVKTRRAVLDRMLAEILAELKG